MNKNERTDIILGITCNSCRSFAWTSNQNPEKGEGERWHHPGCRWVAQMGRYFDILYSFPIGEVGEYTIIGSPPFNMKLKAVSLPEIDNGIFTIREVRTSSDVRAYHFDWWFRNIQREAYKFILTKNDIILFDVYYDGRTPKGYEGLGEYVYRMRLRS